MSESKTLTWRSDFHKALSNPVRLKILDFLKDGEQCQCDIFPIIGLSQSTVSAYLSQLVKAGILNVRRDGTRKLYSIRSKSLLQIMQRIQKVAEEMTK